MKKCIDRPSPCPYIIQCGASVHCPNQVQIFDLGGQLEFLATHPFFFSLVSLDVKLRYTFIRYSEARITERQIQPK